MDKKNDGSNDLERVVNILDAKTRNRRAKSKPKAKANPKPAADDSTDNRPVIKMVSGERIRVLREAEDALIPLGTLYHNKAGILVRVTRTGPREEHGVKYADNALTILPASSGWVTTEMDRAARWKKQRIVDGEMIESRIDAPAGIARFLLEQVGAWRLPYLAGIVECPTLRADGSILEKEGFDKDTGLFFDAGGTAFDPIPINPTKAQAEAAMDALCDVVKDFPYATDADRSVSLSGILTVPVRHMLRDAPLHCASSPRPRSGKSYQSDLAALIATGRTAPAMSAADSPDEEEKRIVSILVSGTPLALIDNIDEPLRSPRLCSAITQDTYRGRLLGGNRLADLSTKLVWFASGNNLRLHDDLNPRALLCYLLPDTDRPEERQFDRDLKRWTLEQRHRLAPAAITVLRAYIVAGSPAQNLKGFGSAPDWSALVRSALVWLGRADPAETQNRLRQNDPVASRLAQLLESWHAAHREMELSAADLARSAGSHPHLEAALKEIASRDGERINTRVLGNYLMAHQDRIESGLKLLVGDTRQGARLYRVVNNLKCANNSPNSPNSPGSEDRQQQHFSESSFYNSPNSPNSPEFTGPSPASGELDELRAFSNARKNKKGNISDDLADKSKGSDENDDCKVF